MKAKIESSVVTFWLLFLLAESADVVTEVRHVYPGCRDEADAFRRDRLDDFNSAFNPTTKPPHELQDAYVALLNAIKPSEYVCTEDYVQLAYKVQAMEQSSNNHEAQSRWAELKQRFNHKVFDLFDSTKTFRIMSDDVPGYAIYATNKRSVDFPAAVVALKRFDARLPDFKWNIRGANEGGRELFSLRSNFDTYFRDTGLGGWDVHKWAFIPTPDSLDSNSTKFKFRLHYALGLDRLEYKYVSAILSENNTGLEVNTLPLHMRTKETLPLWHREATLEGTAVYFLEEMTETAWQDTSKSPFQQAKELYPPCLAEEYIFEQGRLWEFFQAFNSNLPPWVLQQAYGAVFHSIINSHPVICTTDYVDLAIKVFEAEQNAGTLKEKQSWAKVKSWFNAEVFQLFDRSRRWRLMSINLPGYALDATNRKTYSNYAGERNTTFAALMKFDSRFKGFQWTIEPTEDMSLFYLKSAHGYFFEKSLLHPTLNQYWYDKLKHKVIPSPRALSPNATHFAFALMRREGHISAVEADARNLPLNLERSPGKVFGLTSVTKTLVGSAGWYLEEVPDDTIDVAKEVKALYPPCRNEQYLFEEDRLQELLEVFHDQLDRAILQKAYGTILDAITLSPFICAQDYVQLAYKVDVAAKSALILEDQRSWAKLKLRFNPKVFELFDETKEWRFAAMYRNGDFSLYDTGKLIDYDTPSQLKTFLTLKTYDDRLKSFKWKIKQQVPGQSFGLKSAFGGYFHLSSVTISCDEVDKTVFEGCAEPWDDTGNSYFAPTVESLSPNATMFHFKILRNQLISSLNSPWPPLPLYMEADVALGSGDHNAKNVAVYYLEEAPMRAEPRNTCILNQVAELYPPCKSEEHTLEPQRLSEFFEVFNTQVNNASVLFEAYGALLDMILKSEPVICTQDYVQLAYKVQELEQKTNTSPMEQMEIEKLRSQFNPKVFGFFDEAWIVSSATIRNYALSSTEEKNNFDNSSMAILRKYDEETKGAFKWTISPKMDGALYQFRSKNGMYFNGEHLTPSPSIRSYMLVVLTGDSVAPSAENVIFKLVRSHYITAITDPGEIAEPLLMNKYGWGREHFKFRRARFPADNPALFYLEENKTV